jgi:hypothetical protein
MKSLIQVVLLSAIVIVLAMCSNPSEPEENTPLSERETEELLVAMMVVLSDTMPQITAVHGPEEFTIACPEGGDARVTFSATEGAPNDSTVSITLEVGFMPSECGIKGSAGTDFTVSAEQKVDFSTMLTIQGFFADLQLEGGLDGQLDWEVENRSGMCTIDMDAEIEVETDLSDARSVMVGSACDHELTLDISSIVQPAG